MKRFTTLLTVLFLAFAAWGQKETRCYLADFDALMGDWKGTLTYLDYTSGKPFTMPADISISPAREKGKFLFANTYPKEPNANSVDTVVVSGDGKMIDKEKVVSRKQMENGVLEIITAVMSRDGNDHKEALIRHIYTISKDRFVIRKEVQFKGEDKWIMRHEYSYQR